MRETRISCWRLIIGGPLMRVRGGAVIGMRGCLGWPGVAVRAPKGSGTSGSLVARVAFCVRGVVRRPIGGARVCRTGPLIMGPLHVRGLGSGRDPIGRATKGRAASAIKGRPIGGLRLRGGGTIGARAPRPLTRGGPLRAEATQETARAGTPIRERAEEEGSRPMQSVGGGTMWA